MSDKKETNKRDAKCKYCEEIIPKGEGVKHSNRYYHPDCLEEWKGKSDDRVSLIEYVMEIYNIKKPTGMMLMQIKRFHEEFDYTYKGMELTLRYFYEILDNKVDESAGLGIIPYMYEEATEQYVQRLNAIRAARDEDNYKQEERVIYISSSDTKRTPKLINMDDI